MVKRLFDIVSSFFGILILSPLFIMVSLMIKLSSKGPIIFKQERVGLNQKVFNIYKFRSMYAGTDTSKLLTAHVDKRITPVGQCIRKYKLDELPQLFNVLKGDMSVVGPRPPMKKLVKYYPERFKKIIFSVRPGMTDIAYLHFWNESELISQSDDQEAFYFGQILPKKLKYKLYYAKKHNFFLDIKIIFLTMYKIVFRDRA